MLTPLKQSEVWLVTGSQHLYGPETLKQVADNSRTIAEALDRSPRIPCRVVFKPVVKTPEFLSAVDITRMPALKGFTSTVIKDTALEVLATPDGDAPEPERR